MVKRTDVNFDNHHLKVTKTDHVQIYWLKRGGSMHDNVKFIIAGGITAVTGDYGNWIFNREFGPSKNGYVDDFYWKTKLKCESGADGDEWDSEATEKELKGLLADDEANYTMEERHYLEQCLEETSGNEEQYRVFAYTESCGRFYYENVVYCTKTKYWLAAIFDAFEIICKLCIT